MKTHMKQTKRDPIQEAVAHAKTIIWTKFDVHGNGVQVNGVQVDYDGKVVQDVQISGLPCKDEKPCPHELPFLSVQPSDGGAVASFCKFDRYDG